MFSHQSNVLVDPWTITGMEHRPWPKERSCFNVFLLSIELLRKILGLQIVRNMETEFARNTSSCHLYKYIAVLSMDALFC